MGLINFAFGQLLSLLVIAVIIAGVTKLFQLSSELSEMKEILSDIRRNTASNRPSSSPPIHRDSAPASPRNLARAVDSEGMEAAEAYAQNLLKPRDE